MIEIDVVNLFIRLETLERNVAHHLKLQSREFDYSVTHPGAILKQIYAANEVIEDLDGRVNTRRDTEQVLESLKDPRVNAPNGGVIKGLPVSERTGAWGYERVQSAAVSGRVDNLRVSFERLQLDIVTARTTPENVEAIEARIKTLPAMLSDVLARMKSELGLDIDTE